MNKLHISLFALLAALCISFGAGSAQASMCMTPAFAGDWVANGNSVSFPGNQNAWYVGGLRIGMRCVDASTQTCWGEGEERVCSVTSAVRAIYTVSVGQFAPSFTGAGDIFYGAAVDAVEGTDGWRYADATVEGHQMRVWFRVLADGKVQAVFEAWVNGTYYGPHWRDLSRPMIKVKRPWDIQRPIQLAP